MGKSKKRDREKDPEDRLQRLLKKVRKLNDEVEIIRTTVADRTEQKIIDVIDIKENDESEREDSLVEEEDSQPEEIEEIPNEEDADEELEWKEIVGEDPTKSKALEMVVREDLRHIWKTYCREGMKKEEEGALLQKYLMVTELQAPELNPQVASQIGQTARKRDGYMFTTQKLASLSLSIIGALMTKMFENRNTGMDIKEMLEPLKDAGNLLTQLMYKQSINRKAFIEPSMSKEGQEIAKTSKIDEFLFGNNLTEKIKDTKAQNKEGQDLFKNPQNNTAGNKTSNYKAPYKNRPRGSMGYSQSRGRPKQKFVFKGKQQFVNPRARAPQQGPPPSLLTPRLPQRNK